VVRSAKSSGLKHFAELTTPSAPLLWLRDFFLRAQPPLLFKEGKIQNQLRELDGPYSLVYKEATSPAKFKPGDTICASGVYFCS
jgi:hypothetical protein